MGAASYDEPQRYPLYALRHPLRAFRDATFIAIAALLVGIVVPGFYSIRGAAFTERQLEDKIDPLLADRFSPEKRTLWKRYQCEKKAFYEDKDCALRSLWRPLPLLPRFLSLISSKHKSRDKEPPKPPIVLVPFLSSPNLWVDPPSLTCLGVLILLARPSKNVFGPGCGWWNWLVWWVRRTWSDRRKWRSRPIWWHERLWLGWRRARCQGTWWRDRIWWRRRSYWDRCGQWWFWTVVLAFVLYAKNGVQYARNLWLYTTDYGRTVFAYPNLDIDPDSFVVQELISFLWVFMLAVLWRQWTAKLDRQHRLLRREGGSAVTRVFDKDRVQRLSNAYVHWQIASLLLSVPFLLNGLFYWPLVFHHHDQRYILSALVAQSLWGVSWIIISLPLALDWHNWSQDRSAALCKLRGDDLTALKELQPVSLVNLVGTGIGAVVSFACPLVSTLLSALHS